MNNTLKDKAYCYECMTARISDKRKIIIILRFKEYFDRFIYNLVLRS
jgi:hypothetical protein